MYSLRQAASFARERPDSSTPSIVSVPDVGRSMPAIRFSSVVLPLPDGPIKARNEPASTSRSRLSSGVIVAAPFVYDRVSLRHSMSATGTSLMCRVGGLVGLCRRAGRRRVGLADDLHAVARVERRRVAGDELVAGLEPFADRHPA